MLSMLSRRVKLRVYFTTANMIVQIETVRWFDPTELSLAWNLAAAGASSS